MGPSKGKKVRRNAGVGRGPLPTLADDGLFTPEIGKWGEDKYRLVANYAELFARSMRNKWEFLVYVDLFAGAGRSHVQGTSRIVPASPLLILNNPTSFTRYIFCERDPKRAAALKSRIRTSHADSDISIVEGDANACVDIVLRQIPKDGTLCFSFADPFALKNLHFETIRRLSQRRVDHLILIPTGMDANRNIDQYYSKESNRVLDDFLGDQDWRPRWTKARQHGLSTDVFLVREFNRRMSGLDYLEPDIDHTHLIRSDEKNLSLYRLAFYSRHSLAKKFWRETSKSSVPQLPLFR